MKSFNLPIIVIRVVFAQQDTIKTPKLSEASTNLRLYVQERYPEIYLALIGYKDTSADDRDNLEKLLQKSDAVSDVAFLHQVMIILQHLLEQPKESIETIGVNLENVRADYISIQDVIVNNIKQDPPPKAGHPPYKGLNYFEVSDSQLYFGREQLILQLIKHLRNHSFLIVVGDSGSGKSSLVRAGILPVLKGHRALADGSLPPEDSSHWSSIIFTPANHPIESLASHLVLQNEIDDDKPAIISNLLQNSDALLKYSQRILDDRDIGDSSPAKKRLIIFVDQFEELFTHLDSDNINQRQINEGIRQAFIKNLLIAASGNDSSTPECINSPCIVIIALRADFYHRCAAYPNLRLILEEYQRFIGMMSLAELREAIEKPLENNGWTIQPELIDQILYDVGTTPSVLPLMSHALLETWRRRNDVHLTLAGYIVTGRVQGAISKTAEDVFNRVLTSSQQRIAKNIFLRMTSVNDGVEDTHRRVTLGELIPTLELTESVQDIIDILTKARLIVTSLGNAPDNANTVEMLDIDNNAVVFVQVTHEALIREWSTLRNWIRDERDNLRIHQRLTDASRIWSSLDKDKGVLYRGTQLAQALEWQDNHLVELNEVERQFLESSKLETEAIAKEQERVRQQKLQQTQELLAESEARRQAEQELLHEAEERVVEKTKFNNRLKNLAYGLAFLLIIAVISLAIARNQSRVATARQLVTQAQILASEGKVHLATLLALEADKIQKNVSTEVLSTIPFQYEYLEGYTLDGHTDAIRSLSWSPDGNMLASMGAINDGTIIWNAESREQKASLGFGENGISLSWNKDSSKVAYGNFDGEVAIWDISQQKPYTLSLHSGYVKSVDWNPRNNTLISGSADGRTILLNADNYSIIDEFTTDQTITIGVQIVAWHPNEQIFAAGMSDGQVIIWDVATATMKHRLIGHVSTVMSLVWNSDGTLLASGSEDQDIIVWDIESGKAERTLLGTDGWITSLALHPDDETLAAGAYDGQVVLWNMLSGEMLRKIESLGGAVYSVSWNPDGSLLAFGSENGQITVKDISILISSISIYGHRDDITDLAWRPNSPLLTSSSRDQNITLWEHLPGIPLLQLNESGTLIAWNTAGTLLAYSSVSGDISIWNNETTETYRILSIDEAAPSRLSWYGSKDELAIASDDKIIIWDHNTERILTEIQTDAKVLDIAWHPQEPILASTSIAIDSKKIDLWDTKTGSIIRNFDNLSSWAASLAWHPNGHILAVGMAEGQVALIQRDNGEIVQSKDKHEFMVLRVTWHPEGHILASASAKQSETNVDDAKIMLWEYDTLDRVAILNAHTRSIRGLAWHPSGDYLASGGDDNVIQVIPEKFTDHPCKWLESNLSVKEWVEYRRAALYRPTCDNLPKPKMFNSVEAFSEATMTGKWGYLFLTLENRFLTIVLILLGAISVISGLAMSWVTVLKPAWMKVSSYTPTISSTDISSNTTVKELVVPFPKTDISPFRIKHLLNLFINPYKFFLSHLELGKASYLLVTIWLFGLTISIGTIESNLFKDEFGGRLPPGWSEFQPLVAESWLGFWSIIAIAGIANGWINWWIGGWWYQLRIRLSGDLKPNGRKARVVYVYSALIWSLPVLFVRLIYTFAYQNPIQAFQGEEPYSIAVLLFFPWSLIGSYLGVRALFDIIRWRAAIWFLILPMMTYILLIGVVLVIFTTLFGL